MMTTMLKSCSRAETLMCKYIRGIRTVEACDRLKEKPEPLESVVWAHRNGHLNQGKWFCSAHLYPVMKHFYPDGSGLFKESNASI